MITGNPHEHLPIKLVARKVWEHQMGSVEMVCNLRDEVPLPWIFFEFPPMFRRRCTLLFPGRCVTIDRNGPRPTETEFLPSEPHP